MRDTINHFYPTLAPEAYQSKRTQIQRWKTEREKLQAAADVNKGKHKKNREVGMATILSKELEECIVVWVNDLRGEGIPVSPRMLSVKAAEVADSANLEEFEASDKWISGFKRRHRFSLRAPTRQGQVFPPYMAAIAAEFSIRISLMMQQLGITRVYNADQTAVFFEYVTKKTITKRGERTVWERCSGASKERVTTMLLGDSDGNKYIPFVVLKAVPSTVKATQEKNIKDKNGFGVRVWQDVRTILADNNLAVYGNKKVIG